MAFVVVLFRGEELTRRELTEPLVIGRAPECDVSIRDILLSRRHCRIEPAPGGGWAVEDLGSKNGTRIGGELVTRATLRDAVGIRMGNTHVKFYAGAFRRGSGQRRAAANEPARRRPADPFEALSGTVEAFDYKSGKPARDLDRLPTPLPKPSDPKSYSDEDVYSMLTELASSSWDSIYATASGPAAVRVQGQQIRRVSKPFEAVRAAGGGLPARRRHEPADPSLQAVATEPPPLAAPHSAAPHPTHPAPRRDAFPPARRGWFNPVAVLVRGLGAVVTGRFRRRAS